MDIGGEVNGGNAEVTHTIPHPETTDGDDQSDRQKSNSINHEEKTVDEIKMDDQEINGSVKNSLAKKNLTPVVKRKLRKSKANSTSTTESDQELKTKERKRPLSKVDGITSDDSMDFNGFDKNESENIPPGSEILEKLIAEEEALETQSNKRIKRSLSKGPRRNIEFKTVDDQPGILDVNEIKMKIDETTDPLESDGDSDDNSKKPNFTTKSQSSNSPSTTFNKSKGMNIIQQRVSTDISNSIFREPFKFGWKREVVYKVESENQQKKSVEIFYYTPKGKKVRNLREIAEFLNTKELTIDNFTFIKDTTGINDLEYEIITEISSDVTTSNFGSLSSRKIATVGKRGVTRRVIAKTTSSPTSSAKNTGKWSPAKYNSPGNFKIKVSGKRGPQKKELMSPSKDAEILAPIWTNSPSVTRRSQASAEKFQSAYKSKRSHKKNASSTSVEINQRQYWMATVSAGYNALSRVFQYLKVQDLLRVARVCKMWRDLAAHPALWKTVHMKNSQVTDWDGLVATLQIHRTQHLDLRKMLSAADSDSSWNKFVSVIPKIKSLVKLELGRCPVMVVEGVIKACPQLEVLSAMSIKCDWLNLDSIGNLKKCQELRLKAISGMLLYGDLMPLQQLTQLSHLSLTSVKELGKKKIDVLGSLINLESLELGECSDFPAKFGTLVLSKLTKLERLRLEKGQGTCCTFDILDGVSKLEKLHQLELVNFDVKNGFDKHLANCKNIKRLLIIPTYISQSATSNNMVLGGVIELSQNLTHLVWGVTLELLRVTELFVDQCNQMNKHDSGQSIPVLKPVPCLKLIEDTDEENGPPKTDEKQPNLANPQVDILPLSQLQKLLFTALPKTRVKILTIPFHATWRQSISDTSSQ